MLEAFVQLTGNRIGNCTDLLSIIYSSKLNVCCVLVFPSKQACMLHKNNEMKKLKYEMVRNVVNMNRPNTYNSVKWS